MPRKRIVDEEAAASSSTPGIGQENTAAQGRGQHVCVVCQRSYKSKSSLGLHQRYHANNIQQTVRQGWSHEERVLVAREEIRLGEVARVKGNTSRIRVNADLCRAFPHRSMDAVKCLRKTSVYKTLLASLETKGAEAPSADPLESPVRDFGVGNGARKWTTPSPKDRKGPKIRWSTELLEGAAREEARLSLEGVRS